ncbi:MAG: exodeoxyribonuclease V subunit beta [Lysobacteraceae bacterium SCN 69-48]|nr:MAG: exodeoxyribonuclease V subunit beta [Xanthomonadaceae bacterium SCN 69-48]
MSQPAPDPYLDVPLDGVRLVEASAGTGKTYTLATLVTRLVVERGLRIGQVLAVTFTEAATQELRKRIRERLQLALALVDAAPADDESADVALTHALLRRHRDASGESDESLRRRLRQAAVEIDLAAIFTIHGFCARVLREHALEAGQGFDAPELLASDAELRNEVAADLWRQHAQTPEGADDLAALWKGGYEELAKDLPALLGGQSLLPPEAPLPADPWPRVQAAGQDLADAFHAQGDALFDALAAAIDADVMNRNSYRLEWLIELRSWLCGFAANPASGGTPHPKLEKLAADALEKGTKAAHKGKTPTSPLCGLILPYLDAVQDRENYRALRRAALLHRLREDARARMATRKRERRVQGYDDLIDGVAEALEGPHGDALAARLRAQYAVALVDEFQDTDTRQWRIFERVFGSGSTAPALFLIGDPKQAIYGFRGGDVHTYLDAAAVAEHAPALAHNFRSRPAVLAAISALYANAGNVLSGAPEIRFHPVEAGGKRADADFLRDGEPAPALTVWQAAPPTGLDAKGKPKARWNAGEARALATRACTAAIHGVLTDARAGRALIEGRPVQPGDIAVLVRSHKEATMIQQALALLGIPAVAAGKQSLFATGEARELHALLLALLHGADDGRLRTALGTVLLGLDALAVDALERDGDAHRRWQLEAQRWRERLRGGGPLALVGELCAAHGERLLALLDGERRISNYLQLAELLQEAQRQALGLHGLVDWLGRAIAGADANDEAQLLRLESDARRVQIVTLHKSKGLEYPLVFLPFVGIGSNDKSPGRHCSVHAGGARRLHWKFETLPEADWTGASTTWKAEQRAEDARLLYVGLTRAEHALWLASGDFFAADRAALAALLGDDEALQQAGVVFDAAPLPAELPRLPPASDAAVPPAREATRPLHNDWWVYSFSQLARAEAGGDTASAATLPAPGGQDEPESADDTAPADTFDPRFAGNRYGVALHAALEHADFNSWRDWHPGQPAPAEEAHAIATALRGEGYGEDALDDGIALTTQLIGHTLTVALPEGTRLCDVPAGERRPEIEFQFALQPVQVDALLALLHAHGIVRERDRFGARQRLEGLMTGLIDLTYRHGGKWYVLDYKSNRLPGYDDAALQRAMAHSEYDLQALIYTLALHRWLRFRLGTGYDYARDFGGIRYLFCRGLDAGSAASPGIHAQRFPPELVHALDALFGHAEGVAA